MEIAKIGIVGAGQMARNRHVLCLGWIRFLMADMSQDALDAARALNGKNLERQVSVKRSPRMTCYRRWIGSRPR